MIGNMVDPCRFVRLGAHFGIRTIAWTVNLPDVDANLSASLYGTITPPCNHSSPYVSVLPPGMAEPSSMSYMFGATLWRLVVIEGYFDGVAVNST